MAFEVVCGQCQGGLLVETGGVVVACPHCGAHLTIEAQPDPAAAAAPEPTPPAPTPPQAESVAPPPEAVAPPTPTPVSPVSVTPAPAPAEAPEKDPFDFSTPAAAAPASPAPASPAPASPAPAAPASPPPAVAPAATPASGMPDFAGIGDTNSEANETPDFPDFSQFGQSTPTPTPTPAAPVTPSVTPQAAVPVSPPEATQTPLVAPPAQEATTPSAVPVVATESPNVAAPMAAQPVPAQPMPASTPITPPVAPAPAQPAFPDFSGFGGPAADSSAETPAFPDFAAAAASPAVPTPAAPVAATPVAATPVTAPAPAPAATIPSFSPAPAAAAGVPTESISISATPREAKGVSPFLFMLVISYASAVTLAFAYLLMSGGGSSGNLDLPDFPPTKSLKLVKEEMELPPSHHLKLGQSTQFGNIIVTPTRITRGPLEFVHYKDAGKTRESSGEVLKLWLKFENVSRDQEIAPLDERLVFTVVPDKQNPGYSRANNFVCRTDEKRRDGNRLLVYSMSASSEWELKGQKLGVPLQPETTRETFIPSNDEDLSELTGDLVWRVHIRKGYNRRSGHGVTTIIEVDFDGNDIKNEVASQTKPSEEKA